MSPKTSSFKAMGKNVTIYEPVTIIKPESAVLKDNIIISEFCYIYAGLGLYMGNYIHISTHCSILGGGYCILEDFVGVCAGTRIITGSEDVMEGGLTGGPSVPDEFRSYYRSFVICEKHSFLGTGTIIHPGVTIGEGSVVGSGSVVTRDLEPWGVYAGSPARRMKDRPKKRIIENEKRLFEEHSVEPSDFSELIKEVKESFKRGRNDNPDREA